MAAFIAINAIVSIVVTLLVLSWWEAQRPAAPSVNPTATTQSALPSDTTPLPFSTESPAPPIAPTTGGPFVYIIESGDTLGSLSLEFDVPLADLLAANDLAEDAVLSVGQAITIPLGGAAVVAPAPETTPEATRGPALVIIREIDSPGALAAEVVILTNLGGTINLSGWTLSDGKDNRYTLPEVTLFTEAEINLHTRAGTNTPSDLYWGQSEARWGETGTVAYLRDIGGKLVATYRVP
ncbi:MAG TPA: lamin tail domain-containing protein [Anaerolineae bacterium]|nr:lamin tail domain-containing protein [Anaerolineae bacterium]